MKKVSLFKGIINYLSALAICAVFALYLDCKVGWFLFLMFIVAPLCSILLAFLFSRFLTVECNLEESVLAKKDRCSMEIGIYNPTFLPTSPIVVTMTNEPKLRCEHSQYLVSVMPKSTQRFDVTATAMFCGEAAMGISNIRITDFFGLMSFKLKKISPEEYSKKLNIIPDIAKISAKDDNIIKAIQSSKYADESEDTIENITNSFGGFPGYDSREYVPGDPLKRINWKQSIKRDKLLVRLDDELASQSVNVVLDSTFITDAIDIKEYENLSDYCDYEEDEIIPAIAQNAVENALGIIEVFLKLNYTLNFYVMEEGAFVCYEIINESDLMSVRTELSHFKFENKEGAERFPKEALLATKGSVSVFSTPNADADIYEELGAFLGDTGHKLSAVVFSATEQSKKNDTGYGERVVKIKEKKKEHPIMLLFPYLLAVTCSMSIFSVYNIGIKSVWTILTLLVCAAIFAFCIYVKNHKLVGTFLVIILVVAALTGFFSLSTGSDYGMTYQQWFLSGGDVVSNTNGYLLSILLVFPVFFSLVIFYFTRVLYRMSFLTLVSLIPFILNVKVTRDSELPFIVLVAILNVLIYLMYNRSVKDSEKKLVGMKNGIVSTVTFFVIVTLLVYLLPKEKETRYYTMFETVFMGGSINVAMPESYSELSDTSGDADGYSQYNNRRLYTIYTPVDRRVYFKRQTFDYYDFEKDNWYEKSMMGIDNFTMEKWNEKMRYSNLEILSDAIKYAALQSPDFIEEYNLSGMVKANINESLFEVTIQAENFPSRAYLMPTRGIYLDAVGIGNREIGVTHAGVHYMRTGLQSPFATYYVTMYDEIQSRREWINAGGANYDIDSAIKMLEVLKVLVSNKGQEEYERTVDEFLKEARLAKVYKEGCSTNNEEISEEIRNLAAAITKDCRYDWEKAHALQEYFAKNEFVYDIDYKAPDDSPEYFLFESKTGTCSDFASAYVLLARSAGLCVRYAEGYIPSITNMDGVQVIRTNCGHAYPEVYIPNMGYVVYEPTVPSEYNNNFAAVDLGQVVAVGYSAMVIFAIVASIVLALLFAFVLSLPYIREKIFASKLKKAAPSNSIIMLYKDLVKRVDGKIIKKATTYTPYEFAAEFERKCGWDISELALLLEQVVYANASATQEQKEQMCEIHKTAKEAIRVYNKRYKRG